MSSFLIPNGSISSSVSETKLYTKADVNARKEAQNGAVEAGSSDPVSEAITRGLGGKKNMRSFLQSVIMDRE